MKMETIKQMKSVLSAFPNIIIDIAKCFYDDINSDSENLKYIQIAPDVRKDINFLTVKEIQITMKNVLKMPFQKGRRTHKSWQPFFAFFCTRGNNVKHNAPK